MEEEQIQKLVMQGQLFLIIALLRKKKTLLERKPYKKKRSWVRKILQERKRLGQYHTLVQELRMHDREYFFRFLRMNPERYENLLQRLVPLIKTRQCKTGEPISPEEKVTLTLRYLASGEPSIFVWGEQLCAILSKNSEMGRAFINGDIGVPSQSVVKGFNLPHVLVSDAIFGLKPWLMKPYPGRGLDEEQKIFNYRLSRAQHTIENAFGILAARWRIFRQSIKANPTTVDSIVKACICLHNYLRLTDNARYTPAGFVDSEDGSGNVTFGDWRTIVQGEQGALKDTSIGLAFNSSSITAKFTHEIFKKNFNSTEGSLSWQKAYVNSTGKKS
eukprot:gene2221-2529_t